MEWAWVVRTTQGRSRGDQEATTCDPLVRPSILPPFFPYFSPSFLASFLSPSSSSKAKHWARSWKHKRGGQSQGLPSWRFQWRCPKLLSMCGACDSWGSVCDLRHSEVSFEWLLVFNNWRVNQRVFQKNKLVSLSLMYNILMWWILFHINILCKWSHLLLLYDSSSATDHFKFRSRGCIPFLMTCVILFSSKFPVLLHPSPVPTTCLDRISNYSGTDWYQLYYRISLFYNYRNFKRKGIEILA